MPRIAAGALIALPYVSRPTRLVPAAGYSTNRFMDELVKRSASTALENRVVFTAEARFADSISSDGCVDSGSGYPVALPEVHRVIALNAWHKTKVLVTTGAPASVVILVVDDGIQGADKVSIDEPKTFPPAIPPAFAHIYTRKPLKIPTFGERLDELSENRLEPNRNNLPIPHGSAHLHGTHVTGILLGGAFAEPLKDLIAQNFKISIAHLNVLGPGGGDKLWVYNPVYMSYAITNAPEIKSGSAQPMIINLSAGASTRLNNLGKFLASNEALLVAAAGNDKADLTSMRRNTSFVYPAQDGGYGHLHIISVAASQGDRTLAPFSNYGIEHIDVAAPGCRILSLGSNGESALVTMSGTSQATPFVSLTAALLASGGLQLDDIKRRIWKTVDFTTSSITRSVASRGILNLPRALATSFDVVVRKDGSSLYGAAKPQVLRLCRVGSEEEFSIKQFDRVDFDVDADAQRCAVQAGSRCVRLNLRFIDDVDRRDLRHFRNPKFCRMSSDQLDSQRLEFVALDWNSTSNIVEARAVSIPYGEIASIVPAEGHTKGDDFYRNGIIDVTATRLK